jgi:hypothetical protein
MLAHVHDAEIEISEGPEPPREGPLPTALYPFERGNEFLGSLQ